MEELISGAESMQRLLEEVSQEKEKYELQLNEATIRYIDTYIVHIVPYIVEATIRSIDT